MFIWSVARIEENMLDTTIIHFGLPFYGDKSYLIKAIESLLNQTDSNWKLTISENGKVDNQIEDWLVSLNDFRIKYVFHRENIGHAANFNFVMSLIRDKWGVMLGSDDLLSFDYVKIMREELDNFPDIPFIHPRVNIIDSLGSTTLTIPDLIKSVITPKFKQRRVIDSNQLCRNLMIGNWLYFPSICWNMDYFTKWNFDENLPQTLDFDLALKVILEGKNGLLISNKIYCYRRHKESISSVGASDGNRFIEERRFYKRYAIVFRSNRMIGAYLLANLRLTHRLHAAINFNGIRKMSGTRQAIKIVFYI